MMSLSKWERQALGSIEDGLAGSDPTLPSLLGIFSRLGLGQEMPVREKIRALRRRAAHRRRTGRDPGQDTVLVQARRMYLRLGPQRAAFLLWVVISAALIAAALGLNTGGSHVTCAQLMRVACGGQTLLARQGGEETYGRRLMGGGHAGALVSEPRACCLPSEGASASPDRAAHRI